MHALKKLKYLVYTKVRLWRLNNPIKYLWNKYVRKVKIDGPPTFIVGCGHSGTSILLAILGSHSRLYAIPYESYVATQESEINKHTLKFNKHTIAVGKRRWVEKTPSHVNHIQTILKSIPDAKILVITRDGRDVAYSFKKRFNDVEHGIKRWVDDNLAALEHANNENVYFLKYEDIIHHFKQTISSVLQFLDEEYEESLEHYYKSPKKWYSNKISKPPSKTSKYHDQHRNWQINQPLFDGSGVWKKLSKLEIELVSRHADELLKEFNYINK